METTTGLFPLKKIASLFFMHSLQENFIVNTKNSKSPCIFINEPIVFCLFAFN